MNKRDNVEGFGQERRLCEPHFNCNIAAFLCGQTDHN